MVSLTKLKYLVAYWLPTHCCIFIIFIWICLQIYRTRSYGFTKRILKSLTYDFYAFNCAISRVYIFNAFNLLNHSVFLIKLKVYDIKQIHLLEFDCLFIKAWYHLNRPWTFSIQLFNFGINFRCILLSLN